MEEYFAAEQIAEQMHASVWTVRRWIESGELRAHRIGRLVRVAKTDLDRFLAERRITVAGRSA
jgi:excisionase family DNA binding protein